MGVSRHCIGQLPHQKRKLLRRSPPRGLVPSWLLGAYPVGIEPSHAVGSRCPQQGDPRVNGGLVGIGC